MPAARASAVDRKFRPRLFCNTQTHSQTDEQHTDVFSDSYNVTAEQLFDLFGKFGPIR
jgi:RNA recognition motif-containing protein